MRSVVLTVILQMPEPENVAPDRDAAARMFGLDGRVAIVTGASSGLGAAVASAMASFGARVAVVARRKDRLAELAERIGGLAVACDLSELDGIAAVVPAVVEGLGPPEILVNAAGNMFTYEGAESEPLDAIRRTMDLNLVAPFLLAQAVFPHMRAAGRGTIVNVSSISGRVGVPGIPQASYAASKAGLSGLTAELAVQWARHSIRVNTVAPGFFRSEITGQLYESERAAEYLRRNTPLPKEGTADDIVGAILWLVGDAGSYVTGQTVVVDGGWTAR
jgi:NAD(P)-dependent dehydrogenase (short-subunit alcohol dehydrogenase family)